MRPVRMTQFFPNFSIFSLISLCSVSFFVSFLNAKIDISHELMEVLQRKSNFNDPDNRVIVAFKTQEDPMISLEKASLQLLSAEAYRIAIGNVIINDMNAENWNLEQDLLKIVDKEQIVRRLPIGNAFVLEGLDSDQANSISQLEKTVLLTLSKFTSNQESRNPCKGSLNKCATKAKLKRSDFPFNEPIEDIQKWNVATCDPLHKSACEPKVPWNMRKINIPQTWSRDFKGKGIVYGVIDTGVSFNHPVLRPNYLGLQANGSYEHNYNWYDAVRTEPKIQGRNMAKDVRIERCHFESEDDEAYDCDRSSSSSSSEEEGKKREEEDNFEYNALQKVMSVVDKCSYGVNEPCDAGGHGTHVTSTAVGGYNIGAAPEARWMACRSIATTIGREEDSLACLNFFLAPHDLNGENPRPDLRPHVIGNSYGWESWAEVEGAGIDLAVRRLESAGTVMVFAAGNFGPNCGTVHSAFSFTVGATTEEGTLASFSSRGPWTTSPNWFNEQPHEANSFSPRPVPLIIKPDISAPGQSIIGAVGPQHVSKMSGTSMAAPHVAGAITLLLQACPNLIGRPAEIQVLLQKTARRLYVPFGVPPCGHDNFSSAPNNFFGHGELDIEAAINSCHVPVGVSNEEAPKEKSDITESL